MQFSVWMDAAGITNTEFAAQIGASRSVISRVRNGQRPAPWWLIDKIVAATRGEVTADEILEDNRKAAALVSDTAHSLCAQADDAA